MIQIPYEQLIHILNNVNGLAAIDHDGKYIFITEWLAEQLGTTQEEAIGQHISKFVTNSTLLQTLMDGEEKKAALQKTVSTKGDRLPPALCRRKMIYPHGNEAYEPIGAMTYVMMSYEPGAQGEEREKALLREFELLRRENQLLRDSIADIYRPGMEEILGKSERVCQMKELISQVAPTTATVCILGETGTGKELVANAIHKLSDRREKAFVKINCGALPKDLMESELFGYEPGAFTGASRKGKLGKFELANKGTLLLDEIGELPLELQTKLLRAIQSGEIERIGGTAPIPVDVRIICSTNRNLGQMVEDGLFRADLYYRINLVEINAPPLRERMGDIPVLVDRFIAQSNDRYQLTVTGITEEALARLAFHKWPGNVRELEHCIARACIMCRGGILEEHFFGQLPREKGEESKQSLPLERAEREIILQTLVKHNGNKAAAAKELNISRTTLYEKIKKYGVHINRQISL